MRNLWQDVRYAMRMLAKSRAFTLVAVVSLAIGIGANTAIFSVANAVLFPSLPFADPARLVDVHEATDHHRGPLSVSYPAYQHYRDENKVFSQLACWGELPLSLSTNEAAQQAYGMIVSGNYFETLGLHPARGRFFTKEEDETPGAHAVAVISHRFWQRHFGGDEGIIGRYVTLNGTPFNIIGVAPEKFTSTIPVYAPDLWVPMMMQEQLMPASHRLGARNAEWLYMTGRLRANVSVEEAQADMSLLAGNLAAAYPEMNRREGEPERNRGGVELTQVGALPRDEHFGLIGFIGLMLAVVGLVLLIACANLSSLLLSRAATRRREIAVRLALGASRWRLVRQLLTESMLLSFLGGALGVLLAYWMIDLLLSFKPAIDIPIELDVAINARVLVLTFVLSVVTGIIFGLVPALQSSKSDLTSALKTDSWGAGFRRSRLRDLFVAGQIAMSLLLLICAGLFMRALAHASSVHPGAEPEHVQTVTFDPQILGYDEARTREFYGQLIERVRAQPGVEGASLAMIIPVGDAQAGTIIGVEGDASYGADLSDEHAVGVHTEYNVVSPGYFQTMKIPLLRGRDFNETDREGAMNVAVIDETMARRYFAGVEPLGRHFRDDGKIYEIIRNHRRGRERELPHAEPKPAPVRLHAVRAAQWRRSQPADGASRALSLERRRDILNDSPRGRAH